MNERLPTMTPMLAVLSILNSTRPPLDRLDSCSDVVGYRPGFGVRHQATGTEDTGDFAHFLHRGRGRDGDIKTGPAILNLAMRSSMPASSAPAALAASALSVKAMTRTFLPLPLGRLRCREPSGCSGGDPLPSERRARRFRRTWPWGNGRGFHRFSSGYLLSRSYLPVGCSDGFCLV
jgi:hypothetical protein